MNNDATRSTGEILIACTLPEPEQIKRRQEIADEIFKGCQEVDELPDGYAFRYPGSGTWATRLMEFILFERGCCPFFTFELVFEANQGPIWLRVRGAEGVKEVIRTIAADAISLQ